MAKQKAVAEKVVSFELDGRTTAEILQQEKADKVAREHVALEELLSYDDEPIDEQTDVHKLIVVISYLLNYLSDGGCGDDDVDVWLAHALARLLSKCAPRVSEMQRKLALWENPIDAEERCEARRRCKANKNKPPRQA